MPGSKAWAQRPVGLIKRERKALSALSDNTFIQVEYVL
jgi:hypothetical protein